MVSTWGVLDSRRRWSQVFGKARVPLVPITVGEIRTARLQAVPFPRVHVLVYPLPGPRSLAKDYFQAGGGSGSAEPSARASDPA
jgi:hypothetical protein